LPFASFFTVFWFFLSPQWNTLVNQATDNKKQEEEEDEEIPGNRTENREQIPNNKTCSWLHASFI
jgi:hypothetical protein